MHGKWLSVVSAIAILVLLAGVLPASAAPERRDTIHVVQYGETLYSIARRYGVDVNTVARANGITNPNRIYVGQRLTIPGRSTPSTGSVHVVQRGETLSGIALRYGIDVWALARANGITNLNRIYVGQRLTIPGSAPAPAPQPAPAPAPALGPWSAEYFNNATLTAPAAATRSDRAINFNWGTAAPLTVVPADLFSVRWAGVFRFAAATYRFTVKVDDGARLYVDDVLVVDGWQDGTYRTLTAERAMTAGDHNLRVEYYDRSGTARIYVTWQIVATPTPVPGTSPTPVPGAGWAAEFFNNTELRDPPVATRTDPWIGFEWGAGSPMPQVYSDYFSARWTTTAYLAAGTYDFCAMADDGVRIYVNGQRVLDRWHPNNGVAYCGEYAVAAGNHTVKVEYYEDGGNALIYVWWNKKS